MPLLNLKKNLFNTLHMTKIYRDSAIAVIGQTILEVFLSIIASSYVLFFLHPHLVKR